MSEDEIVVREGEEVSEENKAKITNRIEEVLNMILSRKYNADIKIKFVDKEDNK